MPSFPLYFDAKEDLKHVTVELTDEQQRLREQDSEIYQALDVYQEPYRTEPSTTSSSTAPTT